MYISYSGPLSNGWNRMKKALFQPFDINKWIRVGFTAWLAGFTDCNGGSGGNSSGKGKADWDEFFSFPETAHNWLLDNPIWFNLIILGVIFLFILITVITWLSSRGKFMFLHNVVNNKQDISFPWREYGKEGNSLFVWNFFVGWFVCAAFIVFLVYCFTTSKNLYYGDFPDIAVFWSITTMIFMFIGLIIIFGYHSLFLKDFVVPIMYKQRVGVIRGWANFLTLFGRHFFTFIIYGLFIFVLGIAVVITVVLFALITCCIGLLLMAIPFVGAVILLPVSYTFRAFSVEFLGQFGEKYNLFPPIAEV
ncbi:MAG: hypothetical protein HN778_15710 [Prolixibacteraceae bacterium]|jgi:hypothetical protein|nr:hypothetical protein [Prolixibacteraceae bacterium]MBT6764540.1 hypothetical protein [Prolixibacteraceae bacterium]MBT6999956.1 hypothetical protein [Prolixibacteraceae bacterium]MBT7396276.1 hypothetical protein [Prolixibacteraceae bacterium]